MGTRLGNSDSISAVSTASTFTTSTPFIPISSSSLAAPASLSQQTEDICASAAAAVVPSRRGNGSKRGVQHEKNLASQIISRRSSITRTPALSSSIPHLRNTLIAKEDYLPPQCRIDPTDMGELYNLDSPPSSIYSSKPNAETPSAPSVALRRLPSISRFFISVDMLVRPTILFHSLNRHGGSYAAVKWAWKIARVSIPPAAPKMTGSDRIEVGAGEL